MTTISTVGGSPITTQLPSQPAASTEPASSIAATSDSAPSIAWSPPTADLPPVAASAAFLESPPAHDEQLRDFVRHHLDEARVQLAALFPDKLSELRGASSDERLVARMLDALDNALAENSLLDPADR